MSKNSKKKFVSTMLAASMIFSSIPFTALADDAISGGDNDDVVIESQVAEEPAVTEQTFEPEPIQAEEPVEDKNVDKVPEDDAEPSEVVSDVEEEPPIEAEEGNDEETPAATDTEVVTEPTETADNPAASEPDTTKTAETEAASENVVFDHYFTTIDTSLVKTKDLLVQTSDPSVFTYNTNVVSNYDDVYVISCDSLKEARYVFSYYVDKVNNITDMSNVFTIASESDDTADLSDLNNGTDAIAALNDINATNHSGYIALIDTGANANINYSVVGDDVSDSNGHGTAMLNYIREENPAARVISIKVFDGNKTNAANVYAGIKLAIESKVSIINLSFVGPDVENNAIVKSAIQEALDNNIKVVGAAGNNNGNAKKYIPGCVEDAIVVGAVNSDGTKFSSSNYNADLYVVATSSSEAAARYTGMLSGNSTNNDRVFSTLTSGEVQDAVADTEGGRVFYATSDDDIDWNNLKAGDVVYLPDCYYVINAVNADGTVVFMPYALDYDEDSFELTARHYGDQTKTSSAKTITPGQSGTDTGTGHIGYNAHGYDSVTNLKSNSSSKYKLTDWFSSLGADCESLWFGDSDSSRHAKCLSNTDVKYSASWKTYTNSNGLPEIKFTVRFTASNDNFSARNWVHHKITWKVTKEHLGNNVYQWDAYIYDNGTQKWHKDWSAYDSTSINDTICSSIKSSIASYKAIGGDWTGYKSVSSVSVPSAKTIGDATTTKPATGTYQTYYKCTNPMQIYRGVGIVNMPGLMLFMQKTAPSSDYSVLTDDSTCYSFKGTQYKLYTGYDSHEDKATGTVLKTFTLDAQGLSDDHYTVTEFPSTFYIQETTAGKGFSIDTHVYKVYVPSVTGSVVVTDMTTEDPDDVWRYPSDGTLVRMKFKDYPVTDPLAFELRKINEQGQITDATLSDTEFTLEYYAQNIAWDNKISDYEPTVVYHFTRAAGDNSQLKLSDFMNLPPVGGTNGEYLHDLYEADVLDNEYQWPLGTYLIYESTPPAGFACNEQILRIKFYQVNNGDDVARIIHKVEDRDGNQIEGDGYFWDYTLDRSGDEYNQIFMTLDDNVLTGHYQLTKSMKSDDVVKDLDGVFTFELVQGDKQIATGVSQADGKVLWTYTLEGLKSEINREALTGTTANVLELAAYWADGSAIEYEVRETVPAYPYGGTSNISYTQKAPEGWTLSGDGTYYYHTFTVTEAQTVDAPYEDTIVNDLESYSLSFVKNIPAGDSFDRTKVAFQLIYTDTNTVIANGVADATGNITWTAAHNTGYVCDTSVASLIKGLPGGNYKVTETWDKTYIATLDDDQAELIEDNLSDGWVKANRNDVYEFGYTFTLDADKQISGGEVINDTVAQWFNMTKTTTVAGDASTVTVELINADGNILARGTAETTAQPGTFNVTWDYAGKHKEVNGLDTIELPAGDYTIREYQPVTYYDNGKNNVPYTYMKPELKIGDDTLGVFVSEKDGKVTFESSAFTVENNETVVLNSTASNTRIEGDLSIIKVERSDDTSTDKTFNLEIYYRGNDSEAHDVGMFLENYLLDTITITTKNGEGTATLGKIPEGWYEVREIDNDGWTVTWGGDAATSIIGGTPTKLFHVDSKDKTNAAPVVNDGVEENGTPIDGLLIYNDIAPEIGTTFTDSATKDHIAATDVEAKLIDTVAYKRVLPGSYKLYGVLMNKATGEPLVDAEGVEVRASTAFTIPTVGNLDRFGNPMPVSDTVDVEFILDTTMVNGLKAVAFEELYAVDVHGDVTGQPVAEHEDIDDVDQTMDIGDGQTTLLDDATGTHTTALAEKVSLTDYVEFNHLLPGKSYTMTGTLMDKATGEPLKDAEGNEITASQQFLADPDDPNLENVIVEDGSFSGMVKVTFEIDTTILVKKTTHIVAFETCTDDETGVAVIIHADLEDDDQTVRVPTAITKAEYPDGAKTAVRVPDLVLIDTVTYTGLEPGQRYRIVATLMVKETGEPLMNNGEIVKVTDEFVAPASDGVEPVEITFDATGLKVTDHVVVFEEVYNLFTGKQVDPDTGDETEVEELVLVAEHKDINDQDQTVGFMAKTGDSLHTLAYIIGTVVSVAGLAGLTVFVIKRKKKGTEEA